MDIKERASKFQRPKRPSTLRKFGHDSGNLTRALFEALEWGNDWWRQIEMNFDHERHGRWWAALSEVKRARWLLGQLWNCRDTLPSDYWAEISDRDPFGERRHVFTVAALVRLLAKELNEVDAAA